MCNAWNHPWDCTCGFGGEGHSGRREASLNPYEPLWLAPTPAQTATCREWRWQYSQDELTRPTRCPKCGAYVYFVRHNGGNVWLDELGPPWPKHPCFDDEPIAALLRARMRLDQGNESDTFGVITYVSAGETGYDHYVIQCADGSTIDDQFKSGWDRASLPGTLVHVQRKDASLNIERLSDSVKPTPSGIISFRLRTWSPETTAAWFRDILGLATSDNDSVSEETPITIKSSALGLTLLISELRGNSESIEVIVDYIFRSDLVLHLANLERKGIPYEIRGSDELNKLEVRSKSPDGLQLVARVQSHQRDE
jgi:hypothetical protein